jgi:hypothetical protein
MSLLISHLLLQLLDLLLALSAGAMVLSHHCSHLSLLLRNGGQLL